METNRTETMKAMVATPNGGESSLTLPGALEIVLESFNDSCLCENDDVIAMDSRFPEAMELVQSILEINDTQAMLFAVIVELSLSGKANPENIVHKLGCSNLHFLELQGDIDVLIEKRYVRSCASGFRGLSYRVPDEVIKCIKKGEKPDAADIRGLNSSTMLRRMSQHFRDFWRDNIDLDNLRDELGDLLRYNQQNGFVRQWVKAGIDGFEDFERRFLYKIGFSKPGVEAKTHIWETMIGGLDGADARTLACEYDFSGGQIENISRKVAIDYIISGAKRNLDGIRELCMEECTSDVE